MLAADALNLIMLGKASGSFLYVICGVTLFCVTSAASFAVKTYLSNRRLKKRADAEKQEMNTRANEFVNIIVDAARRPAAAPKPPPPPQPPKPPQPVVEKV